MSMACLPHLLRAQNPSITNSGSFSSAVPAYDILAYGTAKAALNQMMVSIAHMLAHKVRVNSILIGTVMTPGYADAGVDAAVQAKLLHPDDLTGRTGEPKDLANAMLWLCSPAGSWVSGQTIQVHGPATPDGLKARSMDQLQRSRGGGGVRSIRSNKRGLIYGESRSGAMQASQDVKHHARPSQSRLASLEQFARAVAASAVNLLPSSSQQSKFRYLSFTRVDEASSAAAQSALHTFPRRRSSASRFPHAGPRRRASSCSSFTVSLR